MKFFAWRLSTASTSYATFCAALMLPTPASAAAPPVSTGRFTPIETCNRLPGAAAFRASPFLAGD